MNSPLLISDFVMDGQLTWTAPTDSANYTLFAIYERYTNQRSVMGIIEPETVVGNGSFITDKFSANGATLVTKFWEKNILDEEVLSLLESVGEYSK